MLTLYFYSVDFYIAWRECVYELKKCNGNLARTLYKSLLERSKMIVRDNDVVLSMLFVDPRFTNNTKNSLDAAKTQRAIVRNFCK